MKIVLSVATLLSGGAERVVSILANSLVSVGHDVEILLFYDREIWYEIDSRVKITVGEQVIGKKAIWHHMRWRRQYLKKTKPDVVVSFLAPFNMVNIVTMAGLKIPLIVADRNDPAKVPVNPLVRKLRDFLYRFADGIVLQNETNQRYFSKAVQRKSTVIYNPVDMGEYNGAALRCQEKKKEIVSVARVIEQKNPMMLLHAFAEISKDFPEYNLVYYGDGDMREAVAQRAKELGLADRVSLPGPITNVFEEISKTELFVMTSEYEGMPNALLEAMCVGLPVISTKVSGAVDVIDNDHNGMLINCGDEKALATAMRRMLSDDEFRHACAQSAVLLADQLTLNVITEQWMNFILCVKEGT